MYQIVFQTLYASTVKTGWYPFAIISVNGENKSLGYFPKTDEGEKLAAGAHDKAAIKHFGEWANLNFPSPSSEIQL